MINFDHSAGCDRIGAAGQHAVELWSDRKCAVPSYSQMRKQFSRQYFMLDEAKVLQQVFDSCDVPCQASKILPKEILQFTTNKAR